jgi:hypothetical protein
MTKLLALATTLIFVVSSFATTAQAGMRVGIGIGVGGVALGAMGAMSNGGSRRSESREYSSRKKERAARRARQEKAPSRTAKKTKSEPTQEASKDAAETTPDFVASNEASGIATLDEAPASPVTTASTDLAAQSENSSISLTSATTADAATKIDTASQQAKSLDCKKFFPSVGMTLSVPCE